MYFMIYRTPSEYHKEIEHLTMHIWPTNIIIKDASLEDAVTITWQKGGSELEEWYGFRLKAEIKYHRHINTHGKMLTKIGKLAFGESSWSSAYPRHLIELLVKKHKAIQVVYDGRISSYVPLAEVEDVNKRLWLDDYEKMGNRYCQFHALCITESEAQQSILDQAKALPPYAEFAKKFEAAGMPVICSTKYHSPPKDMRVWQEILK